MKPLTPEQRNLAAKLLPLAQRLADVMKQRQVDRRWDHEYDSAATWTLLRAIRRHEATRQLQVVEFVTVCIQRELTKVHQKMRPLGYRFDGATPPRVLSLKDSMLRPDKRAETFEEIISELKPHEQELLRDRYLERLPQEESCARLDIARCTGPRWMNKIMGKLRVEYDA